MKLRSANREQLKVVTIDVDQLIPPTHKARAIWCLTGKMDLERMMLDGTKVAAQAGRDTFRREKTLQKRLEAAREVVRCRRVWGERRSI